MAITVSDIKGYWRTSQLNAIADYNDDGVFDNATVTSAIADAYAEVNILVAYHEITSIDLFAKRLTICILLSRLNINPESVVLPINDCMQVRELISSILKTKQTNKADVDLRPVSSGITVSEGITDLKNLIKDF